MKGINFILAGVGGQGTLLASTVVAQVGVEAGFDVKKAEVHGMAQRGGSVNSHVRWGDKIYSPLIAPGEVDYLVVLEKLEALRYLDVLRPGGTVLVGEMRIPPLSVNSGDDLYPDDEQVRRAIGARTPNLLMVPSIRIATEVGAVRAHNVVVLGALSARIEGVPTEVWRQAIARRVPQRYLEVNLNAFEAGRQFACESLPLAG